MSFNESVTVAGVLFKNPVITASGTFNFGREFEEFYPLSALGGISTKGLTLCRRDGNRPPRVAETPSGMLNSVGLQNPGIEYFLKNELPYLRTRGTVIIANIAGSTVDDYREIAEKAGESAVDMLELNISCPNVKEGGVAFGTLPSKVREVTEIAKAACGRKPLIVKLTPNVAKISDNAKAAEDGGADAISLINTLTGLAVDYRTRKPILANVTGGLSGPAVKPIALKMVWECYNAVKIPIIGMGGISSYTDALEFIIAGATAVQVGTANLVTPTAAYDIVRDLRAYLKENDLDVNKLRGSLVI
ncbi:MAG: dihydroorotate dehydrogenase [Clostridiaceae bacterium]|jgi:dihydroorotate dehydrogenase (NAD+) catalytic subunit|nr:dihydroorotate dehydrogenase [Clostridiaceae bacterium]